MNKTKILKGFALVNFISLLTLFLFFRNGSFDKYFYVDKNNNLTSPNGGTPAKVSKDSIVHSKDSRHRQRLSSSKSLVIIDNLDLNTETTNTQIDSIKISQTEEEKSLMSGSKSGIIIDPDMFETDSIR